MAKKDNYIMYEGEKLNLSEWVLPAVKAADFDDNDDSYVRKLIWNRRHHAATKRKQIDFKEIPELGITLVRK